jgi:hypothetical protein
VIENCALTQVRKRKMKTEESKVTKKPRKKPVRRSEEQFVKDLERKLDEKKAKLAKKKLLMASKEGRVSDKNAPEYDRLLSALKAVERMPSIYTAFDMEQSATDAAALRDSIIVKMNALMSDAVSKAAADDDDDDDEEDDEEEEEEEEEDEDD